MNVQETQLSMEKLDASSLFSIEGAIKAKFSPKQKPPFEPQRHAEACDPFPPPTDFWAEKAPPPGSDHLPRTSRDLWDGGSDT